MGKLSVSLFIAINFIELILCETPSGCRLYENFVGNYNCKKLNLTDVPSDLDPNTTFINLSHNNLTEIKNSSFWKYPLLESVDLSFNQIQNIEDNSFEYLKKFRSIDLWSNNITRFDQRFPKSMFQITLSYNPLEHVNISTANIGIFDMTSSQLKRLPNLGPLPKLLVFSLYNNPWEEIRAIDLAPLCYLGSLSITKSDFENSKIYDTCECKKLAAWLKKKKIKTEGSTQCSNRHHCDPDQFDFSREEELWNECMNIRKLHHWV